MYWPRVVATIGIQCTLPRMGKKSGTVNGGIFAFRK